MNVFLSIKSIRFFLFLGGMVASIGSPFASLQAQIIFSKVTDSANAISLHPSIPTYTGASWVDADADGDLDLFVNLNNFYRNEGNGAFTKVDDLGFDLSTGLGNGNTWADMDNDGDLDMYRTSSASALFEQQVDTFAKSQEPEISTTSIRGWSAAWGDYDLDGFVDLVITHPRGFLGPPQNNFLFHNQGDGRFERVLDNEVVIGQAAYTGANWTDYDLDGDLDLFIGSGEVSAASRDHLYQNLLKETDTATLVRIDTGVLGTELRDGQNWNLIDYDNDGDLDGYITNYLGSVPNHLYRNDNGTYVKMTAAEAGPIAVQTGAGLGNIWEDFDNDGDLDCFVTFDGGWDRLYWNQGDGSFVADTQAVLLVPGNSRGPSAGDYDGDGFVDLFISSASPSSVGLYHNEGNSNHWLHLNLKGSISNQAAIGAKVRLQATIFGQTFWQMREISAQNSFNGMNSLTVEFGLGDALVADSVMILWPLGDTTVLIQTAADQVLQLSEAIPSAFLRANFRLDSLEADTETSVPFLDRSVFDTLSPISYAWDFDNDGQIDATDPFPVFTYADTGWKSITLIISNGQESDTILRAQYLYVNAAPMDTNTTSLAPPHSGGFALLPFDHRIDTEIRLPYELAQASQVEIALYELNGKLLHRDQHLQLPGQHEFRWQTESLPAGVYVLVIHSGGNFQKSLRLVRH